MEYKEEYLYERVKTNYAMRFTRAFMALFCRNYFQNQDCSPYDYPIRATAASRISKIICIPIRYVGGTRARGGSETAVHVQ